MKKLKLPSLSYLADQTTGTFLRFPFVLIIAFIGTLTTSYLIETSTANIKNEVLLLNIILTCILGLTLFLSVALLSERLKLDNSKKLLFNIPAIILLIIYYFSLPVINEDQYNTVYIIRFALFALSLHLLVSFVPFIGKNEINGFWEFNRTLFQRILTAVIYSIILYAGLSVALYSVDNLLEIKIGYKIYWQLWIFIIGLFNTCFF